MATPVTSNPTAERQRKAVGSGITLSVNESAVTPEPHVHVYEPGVIPKEAIVAPVKTEEMGGSGWFDI